MSQGTHFIAHQLAQQAAVDTNSTNNEAQLHVALEEGLADACQRLGIPWIPYSINIALQGQSGESTEFADAIHGAVIIEYKRPHSFHGRNNAAALRKAREQAQGYATRLQREEGRALHEYTMVCWDGAHMSFGSYTNDVVQWETLVSFDTYQSQRLLDAIAANGRPLVHPTLLTHIAGPESPAGSTLVPALFESIIEATQQSAPTTRAKLLHHEWARLFGQVAGANSEAIAKLLQSQSTAHGMNYSDHPIEYVFALNTHIALVSKLTSALALPNPVIDVRDHATDLRTRMEALENGTVFTSAGVDNMLSGDFFAWYLDDDPWQRCQGPIQDIIAQLAALDFDVRRKSNQSARDLFKGMYQHFIPSAMRHALGEYYTPDWLAEHVLNSIDWQPTNQLLDPTCGTGTFLLEALRRRMVDHQNKRRSRPSAKLLLRGIYGMDLNPLAVLTARASLVVFLAPYLDPSHPISLPVWLADAINSAKPEGENFHHELLTENGPVSFRVPEAMVCRLDFHSVFEHLRVLVSGNLDAPTIVSVLDTRFGLALANDEQRTMFQDTVAALVELHKQQWDGIWCSILADRFRAGAIPKVSHIVGNPPWVKWGNLPREYAEQIKYQCRANGVFSDDSWFGGIQADISTIITFECLAKWLKPRGTLAFLITGSVITNRSSQGFRRMRYRPRKQAAFEYVEDFRNIRPFEHVSNRPVFIVLSNGKSTKYPLPYRVWSIPRTKRRRRRPIQSVADFHDIAQANEQQATPLPGDDGGPWIRAEAHKLPLWSKILKTLPRPAYRGRKGVCTDRNGIFFLTVKVANDPDLCLASNDPSRGRNPHLPTLTDFPIEKHHVYPLLQGEGVGCFTVSMDPNDGLLVPQEGMHGDPLLPATHPKTFTYLQNFAQELPRRSSYRRYQRGQPHWSVWNVGAYTWAPWKVVWREMNSGGFQAAYVGPQQHPVLGESPVTPDHKVYYVPLRTEEEAAYLAGVLNAPVVAQAIAAYLPALSAGTNVVEHLAVRPYNHRNADHVAISQLAVRITRRGNGPNEAEMKSLDRIARRIFGVPATPQPIVGVPTQRPAAWAEPTE